jgi:tight adherence protein C
MQFVFMMFEPQFLATLFVAVAAFFTVMSVAMPYFEQDTLGNRMKGVTAERDRLRAQQKAMLSGGEAKLRERPKAGLLSQLVEVTNLRNVFDAEAMREKLRQAGFRNEKHVVTYMAARLISPIVLSVVTFAYLSTIFASNFGMNMRVAITVGALVFGYYLPGVVLKNIANRRQDSIRRSWSDALDLLLICVESGMSIEPAMQRVAKEIGNSSVPLAEELTLTVAELSYLSDRRKAFENLAKRTGMPTVKSVVTSLIQAERYGTPLGTALRVLAQENRDARMSEAERKAAALPPKLTVPMILFFLPVIFVVVLGPSAIVVLGFGGEKPISEKQN